MMERFNSKWIPEPFSGCWLWTGSLDSCGYGRFGISGKNHKAARVSWELFKGKIPEGQRVCHKCDTPACVNPDHLWLGTQKDNCHDCIRKGRWQKYDTIFPRKNNNAKTWATRRLRYGQKGHSH